jgi:hypothetical protein
MGFFDKYELKNTKTGDEREDSKTVVLNCIRDQIRLIDPSLDKSQKPTTSKNNLIRSWFKNNECTPVIKNIYLFDGKMKSIGLGETGEMDFLKEMYKGVKDGDFDSHIEVYDKKRTERDNKVVKSLNKSK